MNVTTVRLSPARWSLDVISPCAACFICAVSIFCIYVCFGWFICIFQVSLYSKTFMCCLCAIQTPVGEKSPPAICPGNIYRKDPAPSRRGSRLRGTESPGQEHKSPALRPGKASGEGADLEKATLPADPRERTRTDSVDTLFPKIRTVGLPCNDM